MAYQLARGLRNNNPGNIRKAPGVTWLGQAAEQTDPAFVVFSSPEYGIRALARVLRTYGRSYGLTTVRGIIARWAPPAENDTAAYQAAVARALGVGLDTPLELAGEQLEELVAAIIRHENGVNPYPRELLARGIALA